MIACITFFGRCARADGARGERHECVFARGHAIPHRCGKCGEECDVSKKTGPERFLSGPVPMWPYSGVSSTSRAKLHS